MKRVITLDNTRFSDSCRELGAKIASSGFSPDIVVGIRTGGEYVARIVSSLLPGEPRVVSVDMQRPSTPAKKRLARIIRMLPRPLTDFLRIIESKFLASRPPAVRHLATLPQLLNPAPGSDILVCDDAIDGGATMEAVVRKIREANPQARIRTASLTVTTAHPIITPDYSLFTDLLRFPWSMDA